MAKLSLFQKLLDEIAKQSTYNTANALIFLAAGGWLASSLAQVAGIYFNKNYTKEQKSFMIPQELADAFVNIGAFLLVTKSLKSLTSKMVETGKLTPKSIQTFLREKGLLSERGKFDFNVTEVEGFHRCRQTYNNFKTVAESTAALVGGVVSSNIITPVLRNKIAAKRRHSLMEKLNELDSGKDQQATERVNPDVIKTPRHTFEDFRSGIEKQPYNNMETMSARSRFEDFRSGIMRV